jgi:hypothetical protein
VLSAAAASGTLELHCLPPATLAVVDVTDGAYCSRLYDMFFLLSSGADDSIDDTAAVDPHALQQRLRAYFDAGGQLFSEEEISLLIDACTIKGLAAAQYFALWSPDPDAPALFEQATRAVLSICGDFKDAILAAVRRAQAGRGEKEQGL